MSSAIVDKYIGESARLIREMFGYAKEHQPCIIFMDEIDAIGGRRFSEGTSADREIQRTLMELLSQLDGFDVVGKVPSCCLLCELQATARQLLTLDSWSQDSNAAQIKPLLASPWHSTCVNEHCLVSLGVCHSTGSHIITQWCLTATAQGRTAE